MKDGRKEDLLGVEVMARGRRGRGIGAVDNDAGCTKQEVVQQLLD